MTQQATVTAPVITGAPILTASEQGEPTIEELAALLPTEEAPVLEPVALEGTEAEPVEPAEAAPVVDPAAPTEADAAAERANKAAAQARAGSKRYAATQEALREQAAQVQRAAREAEQLRRRVAQADALDRELKADPYKALKGRGMTDADLAQRAMRENTPEAGMLRLQEQVEQERAARVALEGRLRSEREATQKARAEDAFTHLADDEAAYPRLSQLNADAQLDVASAALKRISANGYDIATLSDAQVAEACERYLAPKRAAKAAAVAPPAQVVRTTPKPSGKTLTNAQAQTRVVAPAAWDSLSEEQQLAHIAASLPEPGG